MNGYQALDNVASRFASAVQREASTPPVASAEAFTEFALGEMKFPDTKIGDQHVEPNRWLSEVQMPQPPPAEVTATTKPPPMAQGRLCRTARRMKSPSG